MQELKHAAKSAIVFGLLGPIIGHIAFIIFMCAHQLLTPPNVSSETQLTMWGLLLSLIGGGLFFAYMFGFVPAIVTGTLYSVALRLAPRLVSARPLYRAVVVAALGAASTLVFYAFVGLEAHWNSGFAFAPYGAIAAFVVGYFWPSKGAEVLSNQPLKARPRVRHAAH
jgi:hypothetical protein